MHGMIRFAAFAAMSSGAVAQSYSSDCISIGAGMVHCDSTAATEPDAGTAMANGLAAAVYGISERHFRSKLRRMVAQHDCAGAYAYAFQKSRADAVEALKQVCPASEAPIVLMPER